MSRSSNRPQSNKKKTGTTLNEGIYNKDSKKMSNTTSASAAVQMMMSMNKSQTKFTATPSIIERYHSSSGVNNPQLTPNSITGKRTYDPTPLVNQTALEIFSDSNETR